MDLLHKFICGGGNDGAGPDLFAGRRLPGLIDPGHAEGSLFLQVNIDRHPPGTLLAPLIKSVGNNQASPVFESPLERRLFKDRLPRGR